MTRLTKLSLGMAALLACMFVTQNASAALSGVDFNWARADWEQDNGSWYTQNITTRAVGNCNKTSDTRNCEQYVLPTNQPGWQDAKLIRSWAQFRSFTNRPAAWMKWKSLLMSDTTTRSWRTVPEEDTDIFGGWRNWGHSAHYSNCQGPGGNLIVKNNKPETRARMKWNANDTEQDGVEFNYRTWYIVF